MRLWILAVTCVIVSAHVATADMLAGQWDEKLQGATTDYEPASLLN